MDVMEKTPIEAVALARLRDRSTRFTLFPYESGFDPFHSTKIQIVSACELVPHEVYKRAGTYVDAVITEIHPPSGESTMILLCPYCDNAMNLYQSPRIKCDKCGEQVTGVQHWNMIVRLADPHFSMMGLFLDTHGELDALLELSAAACSKMELAEHERLRKAALERMKGRWARVHVNLGRSKADPSLVEVHINTLELLPITPIRARVADVIMQRWRANGAVIFQDFLKYAGRRVTMPDPETVWAAKQKLQWNDVSPAPTGLEEGYVNLDEEEDLADNQSMAELREFDRYIEGRPTKKGNHPSPFYRQWSVSQP
jgi:Zn-finger nucleic acid-binding protein